jgi:hypothetical protein
LAVEILRLRAAPARENARTDLAEFADEIDGGPGPAGLNPKGASSPDTC